MRLILLFLAGPAFSLSPVPLQEEFISPPILPVETSVSSGAVSESSAPAAAPAFALPAPFEPAAKLKAYGIPEIPAEVKERLGQYQNTRSASFQDFDGAGMLITTRFAETSQVHRAGMAMGARKQVTFESEPVSGARSGSYLGEPGFFFSKDVGGGENYQLYHFAWSTGRKTLLTDGKSRNTGLLLSRDGKSLVYSSTQRNGKDFDIWLLDLTAKAPARIVYQAEGSWSAEDWSPSGSELLLKRFVSANDAELYRFDLKSKAKTPLLNLGGKKAAFGDARYSPDGGGAYFTTDHWGEFLQLAFVDFATGVSRRLSVTIPWDISEIDVSPDGGHLAFVANEDGLSRLRVLRLPKEGPVALGAGIPDGLISGLRFDAEGRRLGFSVESAAAPGDVYVLDLKTKRSERWTESEVGGLDPAGFSSPSLVHFPSFDQFSGAPRRIPAFVYKPKGEGPFPTVILIHGGPESQHRPGFSPPIQYWTGELGLAVIAPNVRGSSGYGKSYLLLDNGSKREDSVKDIGALLDWLAERPDFDAERVAVYGGSYGGYMVLASLARFSDKLKAGVDIVGISNFVTFLESTQEYRRDLRRAEYGDERDPILRDFLESISPTNLAGDIRAPLFVAQGANDPRVPASEAEQIVSAVGARGLPVWYLLAEDEGHGFQKKKNRDYFTEAVSLFWERHLIK